MAIFSAKSDVVGPITATTVVSSATCCMYCKMSASSWLLIVSCNATRSFMPLCASAIFSCAHLAVRSHRACSPLSMMTATL